MPGWLLGMAVYASGHERSSCAEDPHRQDEALATGSSSTPAAGAAEGRGTAVASTKDEQVAEVDTDGAGPMQGPCEQWRVLPDGGRMHPVSLSSESGNEDSCSSRSKMLGFCQWWLRQRMLSLVLLD